MPKVLPASVILKASLCPWSQSFLNLHGGPSLLHGQRGRIAFTVPRVPVREDPVTPEGFYLSTPDGVSRLDNLFQPWQPF